MLPTRFKSETARLCLTRQDWFVTTQANAGIPGAIVAWIIGDSYYGPRRYYGDRDYYREPGIGIRGPGFSFGVGPGYW